MPYKRRLENWDTFWYTCEFCRNTQVRFFHSFTEARRNKKSDANDANGANEREYLRNNAYEAQPPWATLGKSLQAEKHNPSHQCAENLPGAEAHSFCSL